MKILNNDREVAEQEVDKIMEAVDTNKTGVVDFSGRKKSGNSFKILNFIFKEFLVASMNKDKLLSTKRIEQTFRAFDKVKQLPT